jgi:hypothetical protein
MLVSYRLITKVIVSIGAIMMFRKHPCHIYYFVCIWHVADGAKFPVAVFLAAHLRKRRDALRSSDSRVINEVGYEGSGNF